MSIWWSFEGADNVLILSWRGWQMHKSSEKSFSLWSFFVASCLFVRKTNVCHQNKIAALLHRKEKFHTNTMEIQNKYKNGNIEHGKKHVCASILNMYEGNIVHSFPTTLVFWWNYRQMWEFSDGSVNIWPRLPGMLTQSPFVKSNVLHFSFFDYFHMILMLKARSKCLPKIKRCFWSYCK